MNAYVFFAVLACAVAAPVLLWLPLSPTWRRVVSGSAALLIVVGGWALLSFGQDWLIITYRGANAALRFGLDDQVSAVLVVKEGSAPSKSTWKKDAGALSPHFLADADTGIGLFDPTLDGGAILRLDLIETGLLVRTIGNNDRVFVAGTALTAPSKVEIPRDYSVLRWGASELQLRRESLGRRFMPTLLLLGILVLWASVATANRPSGPAWAAGLGLAGLGVILHARIGTDQALPTMAGFRMAVVLASVMALVGIVLHLRFSLGRRRFMTATALGLALAILYSVGGQAIVGSPDSWVVAALALVVLAAAVSGFLPSVGQRFRSIADEPPVVVLIVVLAGTPILIALLGRFRSIENLPVSGRFLLAVILLWAWAHMVEALPLPPARSWINSRTFLLVLPWGFAWILAAFADTGFGIALGGALLAAPLVSAPGHRVRMLVMLLPAGGVVFLGAFACGAVPYRVVGRLLALPNWMYGMGSGQMASARMLTQEGGLWGEAWGGPIRIRLPEYDADLIASALSFEIGALGLILTALLFVILCGGLLLAVARCDFERNRDASRHALLFVIGGVTFMGLLASFNLAGIAGLLPLTGVPILLLSRTGDGVLVVVALMMAASAATESHLRQTPTPKRDMRVVAVAVVLVAIVPFVAAAIAGCATGLAWLLEPEAVWIALDERPVVGRVAKFDRVESTAANGVAFLMEVLIDDEVVLNGQPLSKGSRRTLVANDEIVVGRMRLVLDDALFDPRLRLAGWVFPQGSAGTIGRIVYQDRMWFFHAPAVNLEWDTRADLNIARLEGSDDGWLLVPDPFPYDGIRRPNGEVLTSQIKIPDNGSAISINAGRTELTLAVLADGRLRVDLVSPHRSFQLSKMDSTYLGGGRLSRSLAFRRRLLEDRRLQSALRLLIEHGFVTETDRGVEVNQAEARAEFPSAVDEIRRYCGVKKSDPVFSIRSGRMSRLADGRIAGLAVTEVRRRLARRVEIDAPLVVLDRHGRTIADPLALGLGAVWGSRYSSLPGLNSLAPTLVVHQEERKRLGLFYPLTGFGDVQVFPLRTWLDMDAQGEVVDALADWSERWKKEIRHRGIGDPGLADLVAGVVLVDDRNRILAIGSTPNLADPQEMVEVLNRGKYDPRVSILALEEVPSGSTMKIAVWSYLLENAPKYFFRRDGRLFFKTWVRDQGKLVPRLFRSSGEVREFAGRSVPPIRDSPRRATGLVPIEVDVALSRNTSAAAPLAFMGAEGLDDLVAFGGRLGMFRRFSLLPQEFCDPNRGLEQWLRWRGRHPVFEPFEADPYGGLEGGSVAAKSLAARMRFHLGNSSRLNGLNVVAAFNTVVNEGVFYEPALIRGLGAGGAEGLEFLSSKPERVMAPDLANFYAGLFRGVVSFSSGRRGTAAAVFQGSPLLALDHGFVGKTGTHQRQRQDSQGRLVPDRSDKVFVGSCRPYPLQSQGRITVFVFGRRAGPAGTGTPGIDPEGAMRTARRILETLSGYPSSS